MPTADVRYSRTAFPADTSSYGDVRYLDPADETTVLRTIPAATLRAKTLAKEKAAEATAKAEFADHPTTPRRSRRGRAFVPKRSRKAAA